MEALLGAMTWEPCQRKSQPGNKSQEESTEKGISGKRNSIYEGEEA